MANRTPVDTILPAITCIYNDICANGMTVQQLLYLCRCLSHPHVCVVTTTKTHNYTKETQYIVYFIFEYATTKSHIALNHFIVYDLKANIYFDPLGFKPDFNTLHVKLLQSQHLSGHQSVPILPQLTSLKLLYTKRANNKVIYYSPFKFQTVLDSTCGLWCVLFIHCNIDTLFAEVTPPKHANRTAITAIKKLIEGIGAYKALQAKHKLPPALDNYTRHKMNVLKWSTTPCPKQWRYWAAHDK